MAFLSVPSRDCLYLYNLIIGPSLTWYRRLYTPEAAFCEGERKEVLCERPYGECYLSRSTFYCSNRFMGLPPLAVRTLLGSIFNPLAGKFSGHTRQKPRRHEKSRNMCTLLIGQNNSDQSEPCRYDLKTTWRQHHDSTANVHC